MFIDKKKVTGTIWRSDVFQKDRFRYFVKDRNKISQLEISFNYYTLFLGPHPPPEKKIKKPNVFILNKIRQSFR